MRQHQYQCAQTIEPGMWLGEMAGRALSARRSNSCRSKINGAFSDHTVAYRLYYDADWPQASSCQRAVSRLEKPAVLRRGISAARSGRFVEQTLAGQPDRPSRRTRQLRSTSEPARRGDSPPMSRRRAGAIRPIREHSRSRVATGEVVDRGLERGRSCAMRTEEPGGRLGRIQRSDICHASGAQAAFGTQRRGLLYCRRRRTVLPSRPKAICTWASAHGGIRLNMLWQAIHPHSAVESGASRLSFSHRTAGRFRHPFTRWACHAAVERFSMRKIPHIYDQRGARLRASDGAGEKPRYIRARWRPFAGRSSGDPLANRTMAWRRR